MPSRLHVDKKNNREPGVSTNITEGMFQGRPFVVQSPKLLSNKQTDQKTSLQQAQNYGHNLSNIQPKKVANQTQFTTVVQPKPDKKKIKEGGVEGSNIGSGISDVVGNGAEAVSAPFIGTTGLLALPGAVNDANDADLF